MVTLKIILVLIIGFIGGWLCAIYYCGKQIIQYFIQEGRTKQASLSKMNEILKKKKVKMKFPFILI
jgi:hypothetical protein